ncbi:MAG: LCP family protein [bacterium]|nr:LCP family protein [bacterium]
MSDYRREPSYRGEEPRRRTSGGSSKSRRAKAKAKRKKRILLFVLEFLVLAIMIGVLVIVQKMDKIEKTPIDEKDITINEEVAEKETLKGYKNIALFGVDVSENHNLGKGARTDTIMILSLNEDTGDARLASVYRDTYLNVGNDSYNKANSAYSKGGPEQALNMLNMNLDLNITDYVTIDFRALTDTINALGGIEIDVQEEEIVHLNNYQIGTQEVTGGNIVEVTQPGLQTLNGLQATSYCRIRYTAGDDFRRTERQRDVLKKVAEKAKKSDIGTINQIINDVFPKISTSFSNSEMLGYAANFAKYNLVDTVGFPVAKETGTIGKKGSCVVPTDLKENVMVLHGFLFSIDPTSYEPSDEVVQISEHIKSDTASYIK